jgi:regulator of replication initiation timing
MPRMDRRAVAALVVFLAATAAAQQPSPAGDKAEPSLTAVVQQLSQQVTELKAAVAEMRAESSQYRAQAEQLRRELRETVARLPQEPSATEASTPAGESSSNPRLQRLENDLALLNDKVQDQYQTKVESGSKYRVRLSGMVLLNMFGNGGMVDSADLAFKAAPTISGGTQGSFGGTLRQSQIRLDVFGPTVGGARTRADVNLDFAGGFPDTENGVAFGLARLRTGTIRLDWPHTSIIAGQDAPFISPLSPTSLATVAQPALSYAGNLWTWIPQVRVEHRIATGESSGVTLQGGVLDPLSGEVPAARTDRLPSAGEGSRQPAFAARVGWSSGQERSTSFGVGGFYSRQNWQFGRNVDAWAAMADWNVPLPSRLSLSGEVYRGRSLGGLGGGLDNSVLFFGPEIQPTSRARGLDSIGGWSQLKYQATPKLEFNVAAGQDNPFAYEFRDAALGTSILDLQAVRNRSALFNFIYKPRSNLLLSTEYRRIDTFRVDSTSHSADQVNFAIGVLF